MISKKKQNKKQQINSLQSMNRKEYIVSIVYGYSNLNNTVITTPRKLKVSTIMIVRFISGLLISWTKTIFKSDVITLSFFIFCVVHLLEGLFLI